MTSIDRSALSSSDLIKLKNYLIGIVSREIDSRGLTAVKRREAVDEILRQAYQQAQMNLATPVREQLFHDVINELLGFGPLQPLLDDPSISEVMVNGAKNVYIERDGKIIRTNITFENDDQVLRVIDRIILPLGRRIDSDTPTVDARRPGWRCCVVQPLHRRSASGKSLCNNSRIAAG